MTAHHPEDVAAGLREAGVRLAAARRAQANAMLDIAEWATRGEAAGLEVKAMAAMVGVTRQTLYNLIERHNVTVAGPVRAEVTNT